MGLSPIVADFYSPKVQAVFGPKIADPAPCRKVHCEIITPKMMNKLREHEELGKTFEYSLKDAKASRDWRTKQAALHQIKAPPAAHQGIIRKPAPALPKEPPKDKLDTQRLNFVFDGNRVTDPVEKFSKFIARTDSHNKRYDDAQKVYDAGDRTLNFWHQTAGYNSLDNRGMIVKNYINTGINLCNAYFDSESMFFGEGDGKVFGSFIKEDIADHEYTHGVTQFMLGNLVYQDESGMLNESHSDVFAAIQEQLRNNQTVEDASWRIGLGLMLGELKEQSLRWMSHPGKAYDNDYMGKDEQPDSYAALKGLSDPNNEDNGNVHLGSSIGNLAFYLLCMQLYNKDPVNGRYSWGTALKIWLSTCMDTTLIKPTCTYRQFAEAMKTKTEQLYGKGSMEWQAAQEVWTKVGVLDVGR